MFAWRHLRRQGFVEFRLSRKLGKLYGVNLSFSTDGGGTYRPCAIYCGIGVDELAEGCPAEIWNTAVWEGRVGEGVKLNRLFWNLYLNGLHDGSDSVRVRAEVLTTSGVEAFDRELALRASRATYFVDWEAAIGGVPGWRVAGGCLTTDEGVGPAQPVRVRPGLTGRFEVVFGVPDRVLSTRLKVSDEEWTYPFVVDKSHAGLYHKAHKEVRWKTVSLSADSVIEIGPNPNSVRNPELYPFGRIAYVKFVPAVASANRTTARRPEGKLAFYFEPYSWSFCYGLNTPEQVREVVGLFREMGADEIHTQVIRVGSRSLHHGRVAQRCEGKMPGDDQTHSGGPAEMVRSIDVLRETIAACRELGVAHYANAGLTNCYPGTDLEDRISREHPEWKTDNWILRYSHPETRAYAAAIVREFVEWGADGVSVDCMRYPHHHTEQDLVGLFEAIREAVGEATPVCARIPAGDVVFFRAFEPLARSGIVRCVIPSRDSQAIQFSLKPYLRFKDFGCKVYGRVDPWKTGLWWDKQSGYSSLLSGPSEVRRDIARFLKEGADGIFVYQADLFVADALTRTVLDWRRW